MVTKDGASTQGTQGGSKADRNHYTDNTKADIPKGAGSSAPGGGQDCTPTRRDGKTQEGERSQEEETNQTVEAVLKRRINMGKQPGHQQAGLQRHTAEGKEAWRRSIR